MIREELTVEIVGDSYTINGQTNFEFENGVEYVLNCAEPIWLTWGTTEENDDVVVSSSNVSGFSQPNLTHIEHHNKSTDNLIYWASQLPLSQIESSPIGKIHLHQRRETIQELSAAAMIDSIYHSRIEPSTYVRTTRTQEEALNIAEIGDPLLQTTEAPVDLTGQYGGFEWVHHERYLGIVRDGVRMPHDEYSVVWSKTGASNNAVSFDTANQSGSFILKTDLVQFAVNNGSNRVTLALRPGEERSFVLNNYNRSRADFVCRGRLSSENRTHIKTLFDDYILNTYPGVYELLKLFFDWQSTHGQAFSYLRNMTDFWDIDKMPESMVRETVGRVFTPFDSLLADSRFIYKRLKDFYTTKGSKPSIKWLTNVLFSEDFDYEHFGHRLLELSESKFDFSISTYLTDEDFAASGLSKDLTGYTAIGESTQAVAVIDDIEEITYSGRQVYRIRFQMIQGKFSHSERLLVNDEVLNPYSFESNEIGIVGFNIVKPGRNYQVGQRIVVETATGDGLVANVTHVGKRGEVLNYSIRDQGWFFRNYQNLIGRVNNETAIVEGDYDVTAIFITLRPNTDDFAKTDTRSNTVETANLSGTAVVEFDDGTQINTTGIYSQSLPIYDISYACGFKEYVFVNPTGFDVRSPSDQVRRYAYTHSGDETKSAIFADESAIYLAFEDHVDIITWEFLDHEGGEYYVPAPKVFTIPVTGTPTAVHVQGKRLVICTDAPDVRVFDLVSGSLIGSNVTPEVITDIGVTSFEDVVTYQYYGTTTVFAQPYVARDLVVAELSPVYGRFYRDARGYREEKSLLSGTSVLANNVKYHNFSLGFKVNKTTEEYLSTLRSEVAPVGFDIRGVYRQRSSAVRLEDRSIK